MKSYFNKKNKMLDGLKSFQSQEKSEVWDTLQAWIIIKEVLLKVKDILENHWKYNESIESLSKEILARAMILDSLFNLVFNEEIESYHYIPAIWIFFKWIPIFLNNNYVHALWAEDVETLKQDIIQKKALEKYYTPESKSIAKLAVLKLWFWEWYKDLRLTTVWWKKISWNSFWKIDWLEIRIWNDITYWTFKYSEIWNVIKDERLSLKTKQLVTKYIIEVWKIIHLNATDRGKLIIFTMLSEIIDKIWNDGQFLMNITKYDNDGENTEMEACNENYLQALWISYQELFEKIKNGTFYKEHYSWINRKLIKWLMKSLKNEWFYTDDLTMIDVNWVPKTYSWIRLLIADEKLWLSKTFWIWTNAIWADNVELIKLLN